MNYNYINLDSIIYLDAFFRFYLFFTKALLIGILYISPNRGEETRATDILKSRHPSETVLPHIACRITNGLFPIG